MNKKFLSAVLFGAFLASSTGTFVSCKDYDDDIKDLQSQIDKKASIEDLKTQLSTIESSLAEAKTALATTKTTAEAAKTAAEKAEADAKKAGDSAAEAAAAAKKAAAEVDLKAAEAKEAAVAAAEKKVAALKAEIEKNVNASLEEIQQIATKVDAVAAEAMQIVGHRLSTLAVIPTTHVNGIAAITLTTLKYNPQKYVKIEGPHVGGPTDANHPSRPVLDHVSNGANAVYISTEKNEAYFHVSPSMGVRTQDITMPSFDCIKSENVTRGVDVANNSPIAPTSYSIDKNVLTVNFKKTVTGALNPTTSAHATGKEEFYMASLKAPIAEENWTEAEKKAGEEVNVNSEYVRLHELVKVPYLVNTRTDFAKIVKPFADEVQSDAKGEFYVHYHDSLCVYDSKVNELVDVVAPYDKALDLKKLVTVCVTDETASDHAAHEDWTAKYKNYGLSFRFYLATAAYNTLGGEDNNSNKTDQQKFAKIDTPANGLMSSQVYTINGGSATAVGREPIVRVELRDTINNNLVAQRYIKIKWAKTVGEKELTSVLADSIYVCGNYQGIIGTQKMNEDIYDKVKVGGMTKNEFHSIYKDADFDGVNGKGEGKVVLAINNEGDVESYNIVWNLTHADIVAKYPNWSAQEKMEFSKVCTWKDATKANATLVITLKRTIYKPVFHLWGYDGRYWVNDGTYTTFNINPVVYKAKDWNPGWGEMSNHLNAPTCNIYTDLLNGFLDDMGKKPTLGADGAIWFEDKGNATWAGKKLYYSKDYPVVASGFQGVARTTANYTSYETEGVRFVFDKAKLEAADTKYVYDYYDKAAGKVVQKTATVSADGTILYVNGQVAARIHNYRKNFCQDATNPIKDDMTYQIVLEEDQWNHAPYAGQTPTEAAKAIVGKIVPIKLMADLCWDDEVTGIMEAAHTELIKAYDANIIDPLTIREGETDNFTDATVAGSTIDVKNAFTYTCWNADEKGEFYTAKKDGTPLEQELYKFYECMEGKWMTNNVSTNLKLDANGNLVPTEGVTDGPLPTSTTVTYNSGNETLTYSNHSGTPVNWDYTMYIPVEFGYKWKTFSKVFVVKVSKNAGTPAE